MNTQANAMPESFASPGMVSPVSVTRPMYWALRRELWENRYIYIAPLAVAVAIVLGFSISMVRMPQKMHALSALDPIKQHQSLIAPYDYAAGFLMLMQMLVCAFYSLEALHGERRDRSILFWKSLPVSDVTTVLSKATVPIFVVPLLTGAVSIVTMWIMLLIESATLAGSGYSVTMLWRQLAVVQVSLLLAYHLLAVHSLWHAPFYGWFLLVSSWARRAPFLWAFLPPLAIGAFEKILFNTSHFANLMAYRLAGGPEGVRPMDFPIHPGMQLTPLRFLGSAGVWDGLLFTAICLVVASRLRRYRGPSD